MRTLKQIIEAVKELEYDLDVVKDERVGGRMPNAHLDIASSHFRSVQNCLRSQLDEDAIRESENTTKWVRPENGEAWLAQGKTITMSISNAGGSEKHLGCFRANWFRNDGTIKEKGERESWPRYYLDLQYAKLECHGWMKLHGEWI